MSKKVRPPLTTSAAERVVFSNASALLAVQIANYIFPFLVLPYLTRTLGPHTYGVIAFGLSVSQLACIITDYGFALSATYVIARHRDDKAYVCNVVGGVYVCKMGLVIVVSLAVAAYALLNSKYAEDTAILTLMVLPIIGQTFQPVWFFQGVEKMVRITLYTLASKLVYVVLVLALVRERQDAYWVPVAFGCAQVFLAVVGIWQIYRDGYAIKVPNRKMIRDLWVDSTSYFWARAAVATYTSGGAFFLGLFSTPPQVAFYASAEQLYRAAQSLMAPMSQAIFPHMAKSRNFRMLFTTIKWMQILCLVGVSIGLVIAPWLIRLLFGEAFIETYPILIIFLITLTVTTPSVLLGYPLLGALGKASLANLSVLLAGGLQILLLTAAYWFGETSAMTVVSCVLLVETTVLILRAYWGRREYRKYLLADPRTE